VDCSEGSDRSGQVQGIGVSGAAGGAGGAGADVTVTVPSREVASLYALVIDLLDPCLALASIRHLSPMARVRVIQLGGQLLHCAAALERLPGGEGLGRSLGNMTGKNREAGPEEVLDTRAEENKGEAMPGGGSREGPREGPRGGMRIKKAGKEAGAARLAAMAADRIRVHLCALCGEAGTIWARFRPGFALEGGGVGGGPVHGMRHTLGGGLPPVLLQSIIYVRTSSREVSYVVLVQEQRIGEGGEGGGGREGGVSL
jgi:hypothetical protein